MTQGAWGRVFAVVVAAAGLVACSTTADGEDGAAETSGAAATKAPSWRYVEVPGTTCLNGETAGYGISVNPSSDKLMIYFEGGGACFDDACDFTAFCIPFVPPPDGIFDRHDRANPVRDWSMVYVPYCTGDIHGGDNDAVLAGQTRHFHGYTNVAKFLKQWVPAFANVKTVMATGISAGGFGAGINAAQIADAFGPGKSLVLLDDSGPPLSKKAMPPCLQATFREVWGLDKTVLAECGADCPDPNDFAVGLIDHLDNKYPNARVGLFSNTADLVIRTFMGFGWSDGRYDDCSGVPVPVPADVYEQDLLAIRARYSKRASTFYIGRDRWLSGFGEGHTTLRGPSFALTSIDGVSVSRWVGDVIAGKVTQVGP